MYMKGFTYGYESGKGSYLTEQAKQSQDSLIDTGINWVCLATTFTQERYNSTEIHFNYSHDITDKDIILTIRRFHERNIKVCLKPMINCQDGMWRALIDFPDKTMFGNDVYWDQWFSSYTAFLCHYAEIAEDEGCELLCIGCEMLGTERKERHWRNLIEKIRTIYHGELVYNTNHGKEDKVKWFDALDYIGTSAYYPVAKYPGDSTENMIEEWKKVAERLERISKATGKPILFMEVGCRSARGCAKMPWDMIHKEFPVDEEEQANFYDSCLTVFHDQPWFAGIFFWEWTTEVYTSKKIMEQDKSFNIYKKKAEQVVRKWYGESAQ